MNSYEMINIVDVNWGEGDVHRAEEMITGEIAKAGGEVLDVGSMGRRKLAYPITGQEEGLYLLSHFSHPPEGITPLRDSLKLNQAVIRTLIVRCRVRPDIELSDEEVEDETSLLPEPGLTPVPASTMEEISAVPADDEEESSTAPASVTREPPAVPAIEEEELSDTPAFGEENESQNFQDDYKHNKPFPGEDSAEGGVKEV